MERYDLNAVPNASSEKAGVLRVANEVDEKNSGCKDAAITPSNLYSLLDCRKANTAYTAGAIVSCPYHKEFLLKCTTGGTTSANSLDTTAVTKGNVITDGGVKWTVIASQIIDIAISSKTITVTFIDGTNKTLITQDTEKPADMSDYIIESYRNGTEWYEVYKSGKVRQGGWLAATSSGRTATITFLKPFADTNYNPLGMPTGGTLAETITWQYAGVVYGSNKNATNMQVRVGPSNRCNGYTWIAEGQGA